MHSGRARLRFAAAAAIATLTSLQAQGRLRIPACAGYAASETVAAHAPPTALRFYAHFGRTGECGIRAVVADHAKASPAEGLRLTIREQPDGPERDPIGPDTFAIARPGYYRITVATADGSPLRHLAAIELSGPAATDAHASTVERRNSASVHLSYPAPADHGDDLEWFYCELTPRTDPLYTYYMATGWHRGYFGMQVNSPTERRLIFSVWDAGSEAVDRAKVAAEDRVQLVAKGSDVHASGFGHEGTGGHSHLVHDWRPGETFRFLLHAEPDGTHTTYSGWFWFAGEENSGHWGLIASFRAPKDGRCLHGLYSFVENFGGSTGDRLRDCEFGNAWVRTRAGNWLPLRTARFTYDGHGKTQRLDRHGGVRDGRFYLQSGGFVSPPKRTTGLAATAGQTLELPRPAGRPPTSLPHR